jgi:hypothetical protein
MQQRRLRLGDIVDDYCPRERRITNHAVVAMVEDEVKHTRCTTCDADHEYKQAKVPPQRRRKESAAVGADLLAAVPRKRAAATDDPIVEAPVVLPPDDDDPMPAPAPDRPAVNAAAPEVPEEPDAPDAVLPEDPDESPVLNEDDGPVHRRLIRATLPRPEGQLPERKLPEFTAHQREANGNRPGRGPRRAPRQGPMRSGQQGGNGMGPTRFGGQRSGQPPRHGSGQGHGQPHGTPQGQRPRRKRGR